MSSSRGDPAEEARVNVIDAHESEEDKGTKYMSQEYQTETPSTNQTDSKRPAAPLGWSNRRILMLVFYAAGLIGSFLLYGVAQERIMTRPYGEREQDKFRDSTFLVLLNRIVASSVSAVILLLQGKSLFPAAPIHKFGLVSVINFIATWCQYEALLFVNFPLQTLVKTGKIIPVMLTSALISPEKLRKYSLADYVSAFLITVGCTCFVLFGDVTEGEHKVATQATLAIGLTLMLGYLFFDGFTSTLQEYNFRSYDISTYEQMLWVNFTAAGITLAVGLGTGTVFHSLAFVRDHPTFFFHAFLLSLFACTGQIIIYSIVKEFGAVIFSTIMVTRQVISLILSCIIYLHPLTIGQALSGVLVFATLYYKALAAKRGGK